MRLAWVFLALPLLAVEAGYVDPQRCRPCHVTIFESYSRTGMGRSFAPAEAIPALPDFLHGASGRRYSILKRAEGFFLRRTLPSTKGVLERRIDYVIGSGNHSKTLVHQDAAGRLLELPVSWYSEQGGHWAMSPGYDRPDHSEVRRELSANCLFCHNGYPSEANKGLAMGIDCQRCHGPGEAHVESRGNILNSSRLSRRRQVEVCMQCHMESASRTLPDAVRRVGRSIYSFRPGEALENYKLYFEFTDKPRGNLDGITVNSSAYQLQKSACFQKSGTMTCTTCHDPHLARRGPEAVNHYTAQCRGCHATAHGEARSDCISCHMQKRRTEDAVHVVMTDHLIRRKPLAGDHLAPLVERHDKQSGRIKLLYPARLPNTPGNRLAEAMAQARASADLPASIANLQQAIRSAAVKQPEPYLDLAAAFAKSGRTQEAISAYRQAISYDSDNADSYVALADLLLSGNEVSAALALLEPAALRMQGSAKLWNSLSVVYARGKRLADALRTVSRALEIDSEDPLAWVNLGVCLHAKGDKKGAEAAYRQALLLQPDLSRAKDYLKLVLVQDGVTTPETK